MRAHNMHAYIEIIIGLEDGKGLSSVDFHGATIFFEQIAYSFYVDELVLIFLLLCARTPLTVAPATAAVADCIYGLMKIRLFLVFVVFSSFFRFVCSPFDRLHFVVHWICAGAVHDYMHAMHIQHILDSFLWLVTLDG